MPQKIREIMTPNPIMMNVNDTVGDAARTMRDRDIGCLLVVDASNRLCGVVTDRDLVVRSLADGKDPRGCKLQDVCSEAVTELTPDDTVDNAIKLMARKHIRRIPIMEGTHPVGVLSLGDLALERDPDSVLSSISSAAPNN